MPFRSRTSNKLRAFLASAPATQRPPPNSIVISTPSRIIFSARRRKWPARSAATSPTAEAQPNGRRNDLRFNETISRLRETANAHKNPKLQRNKTTSCGNPKDDENDTQQLSAEIRLALKQKPPNAEGRWINENERKELLSPLFLCAFLAATMNRKKKIVRSEWESLSVMARMFQVVNLSGCKTNATSTDLVSGHMKTETQLRDRCRCVCV